MTIYDLVVKNGKVVDPLSETEKVMNLGIVDGKIITITLDNIDGKNEIDATGCIVSPGFIDIHTHTDGNVDGGNFLLKCGVTSAIGGNCGWFFFNTDMMAALQDENKKFGEFGSGKKDWGDCFDLIDEKGYPVNLGMFVGTAALREMSGQLDINAPANNEHLQKMEELAEKAMNDGAFGVSFGLSYNPGTSKEELVRLFQVASNYNGFASIHPRTHGLGLPGFMRDAVYGQEELIEAAKITGVKLQIGHIAHQLACKGIPYNSLVDRGLKQIEDARAAGVDVMADCFPIVSSGLSVDSPITSALLGKPTLFEKTYGLKVEQAFIVMNGPHKGEGLTKELYATLSKEAPKTVLKGTFMREDLMLATLIPSYVMVSSDCAFYGISPAQTKVLGQYVREKQVFTLSEAIYKLSTLPAIRLGLENKGKIGVGCDADLTIFNPETVDGIIDVEGMMAMDGSDKTEVIGVEYVVVNGKIALKEGQVISSSAGKTLRHQPWG